MGKTRCLLFAGALAAISSLQAANFTTTVQQGTAANWSEPIWQPGPVSPSAGNTYVCLAGGNPTRVRNPASGSGDPVIGVKTFPGDSLQLDAASEIRAKGAGNTIDFPGVGGAPGLIFNGGNIDTGDDGLFGLSGVVLVQANSTMTCGDAAQVPRGWVVSAEIRGSGNLQVTKQVNSAVPAVELTSSNSPFTGGWTVKSGLLKGAAFESLGSGNIVIAATNSALVLAQLELNYDISSPGTLTLSGGGQMILHQDCTFTAVTIEGTALTAGKHSYATLAATYPNNFAPNGAGSITVPQAGRVVTVNTTNNASPGVGETSLNQALSGLQEGDTIRFNIPGAGPHVIVTPLGGYPLMTANNVTIDGYSQPGSAPNTNSILGGNSAQIKIVLDSTGADSGANDPQDPSLNSHRSTRILHSGYGDSENGMLVMFAGDNFTVRGLSFMARRTPYEQPDDPSIYAVALVNQSTGARIQGCWFGLSSPGQTLADVRPPASAVAAFRYQTGGDVYSSGCTVGTDGDGVTDRAEFNVIVGGRIALAIQAPDLRISGNYINVYPDGNHFVDLDANYQLWRDVFTAGGSDPDEASIENFENGRVADNTLIGTDGNGVSDSDERNILNHTVYEAEGEIYSGGTNIIVAGNYYGVGVDGVTKAPVSTNIAPNLISLPGRSSIRIGSNGDGVSDAIEGNLFVGVPGDTLVDAGSSVPIVQRRNRMVNNNFQAIPFADGQNGRAYSTYYAPVLADASMGAVPVLLTLTTNGILNGTIPAPNTEYPNALIDLYTLDAAAIAASAGTRFQPGAYLTTFTDNGPGDLDPAPNQFSFNISSFNVPNDIYVSVAVTYSKDANNTVSDNSLTGPMSNPVNPRPILHFERPSADQIVFWWLSGPTGFFLQVNPSVVDPNNWLEITDTTYLNGKTTTATLPIFFTDLSQFFRLISQ